MAIASEMTCFPKGGLAVEGRGISPGKGVREAIDALRHKDVRSTTLERLRITWEADACVAGLSQPLQLGEGLYYLLDRIAVPVSTHDIILGRISEEVPDEEGEAFFQHAVNAWGGRGLPPWMADFGHECLAWDRLLRLGFSGLERFARGELERRAALGENEATLDFLRGAVRVYQAHRRYAERYGAAAKKAGLAAAGTRCARLADGPPESFAEALQLIWLVCHVYCTMLATNPTLTLGRLDELLLPYYLRDLRRGSLTREEAGDLIEDFYCKNNLILGRGEHQMGHGSEKDTGWARNLAYDAPQYVVLGGQRLDGSAVANDLTTLFLERIVPRFENPVIVLRYTKDLPLSVWRLACRKMRANASFMVYNDERIIPAMIHAGIEPDEAVTYTMHGCNWPDVPGIQRSINYHFLQLPRMLRAELFEPGVGPSSTDEVYEQFRSRLREEVEGHAARLRKMRASWEKEAPGILRVDDCFLDGPTARARSCQVGGLKYVTLIFSICGIATAADILAALDKVAFAPGGVSLDVLRQALCEDFRGSEALRQRCLGAPKYGQDDDRADRHAVRVLEIALEEVERACACPADDRIVALCCLETDMRHIPFGRELGATPDGRHADQPINENTSPNPGACLNGLTAMFRSVAKLPFHRIHSGALNVRLQPRLFAGEEGLSTLAQLLRAYFDMGGLQVQLSFADVDELRDAQLHPERHRDLMVRITGYSAAFIDMTHAAQDEIIRREEMGA